MRKKIIDIITENNFEELSPTFINTHSIVFDGEDKAQMVCNTDYKTFRYVDTEYSHLETCVTLKALYYKNYEDVDNQFSIYKANRLIFEGKIETEEEFKTLIKMLSL